MTEMLTCRRCHAEPAAGGVREVGEWIFCEPCFQLLLASREEAGAGDAVEARPEAGAGSAAAPSTEAGGITPRPEPSPAPAKTAAEATPPPAGSGALECMLCDQRFEPGEGLSGRLLTLCPSCVGGLLAPYEAAPEPEIEPRQEKPEPVRGFVDCVGCDRRIPRGGAREHEDGPVCPECHLWRSAAAEAREAARTEAEAEVDAGAATASAPGRPAASVAASACAACGSVAPLSAVAGFSLCEPCRSVEPELALEVARARHRKRLMELRDRLS